MIGFITKRLLTAVVVLAIVSLISFSLMQLVPGDPAVVLAGVGATADQVEAIRQAYGLDMPLPVQIGRWYLGLLHGDLGRSVLMGSPVTQVIAERLPATLSLTAIAFAISLVVGTAGGILAALNQDRWFDRFILASSAFGLSIPSFWLAILLIIVFSVNLNWLPAGGYVPLGRDPLGWAMSMILPAFSLALLQIGYLARITRTALVDVLSQDYIRTAVAKGIPHWRVVTRHAVRNALIPVVTVVGIIFSLMLSGSVVIETVFSIPGLGRLMSSAIMSRDYPVIQGTLLVTAAAFSLINLLVDIIYAVVDPRVKYD